MFSQPAELCVLVRACCSCIKSPSVTSLVDDTYNYISCIPFSCKTNDPEERMDRIISMAKYQILLCVLSALFEIQNSAALHSSAQFTFVDLTSLSNQDWDHLNVFRYNDKLH